MFLSAGIFGIKNSTISLVVSLIVLFLVVIWLALVYWTWADARRRIADPMLVYCAAAASLFPFAGTIVYMIVRPPEYLEDVRERELEMQAAEAQLAGVGYHLCPHCDAEVEKDFLRCPNCMRKLKDPCRTCGKPLDPSWKLCPFCEAEVGSAPPPRRVRRRREPAAEGTIAGASAEPVPASRSAEPVPASRSAEPVPASRSAEPVPASRSAEPVPASRSGEPGLPGRSGEPGLASRSSEPGLAGTTGYESGPTP